jgi:EAL domain-containing protein (putative c-di-GMP-specific phosphodiesterase class I)
VEVSAAGGGEGRDPRKALAIMHEPTEHASTERQLLELVRRLERNVYGWRAVHLHLSELKPHNRRDYQLRIAASEFDPLLRRFNSELFQLANGDIVYLWEGESVEEVDGVVLRLRYLFSDDPLVGSGREPEPAELEGIEDDRPVRPDLCGWYDLERDYDQLRYALEDLVEALEGSRAGSAALRPPLEPAQLAGLERGIAEIDFEALVRRQPICAVFPKAAPRPVLREVHVAVGVLGEQLLPGVDLAADPWLFQHLAESLDRRLLALLAEEGPGAGEEALSINLRLATLLSPAFLDFDQRFRLHSAKEVVVELQLIDIFAELGAYLFIREFIRERGYRICIDGLHHLHLPLINRKRLGADLVKLLWSPDVLHEVNATRREELQAAVRHAGVDRVILCRCDSAAAVEWGLSLGIRLFQGHYIDSRLRAARSPAIAAARQALRHGGG